MDIETALLQINSMRLENQNRANALGVAIDILKGMYVSQLSEISTLKAQINAKEVELTALKMPTNEKINTSIPN